MGVPSGGARVFITTPSTVSCTRFDVLLASLAGAVALAGVWSAPKCFQGLDQHTDHWTTEYYRFSSQFIQSAA